MIKLVASDLDGTLLDPAGNLPDGVFDVIEDLHARGVLFCAASGRQLVALREMFAPVADKILIMAENGALVARGDSLLYARPIGRELAIRALEAVRPLPDARPLVCTPSCAYYEEEAQPFLQYVRASYLCNAKGDLAQIAAHETVCKIAVYDERGPENNGMQVLPRALPQLRVIQSGGNWLDISDAEAHKGNAIRFLLGRFGLRPEECAAFGDHMNDYEMLLACGHPYVTENAFGPLKQKIGKIISSNERAGVLSSLRLIAQGILP